MKQKSHVHVKTKSKNLDLKILYDTPPWDWPKNAGETFQAVLTDRSAPEAERLMAAEMAGDYVAINNELAETLMGVLGSASESAKLRSKAAIALGPGLESADTGDFDDPVDPPPIGEEVFHKIQRFLRVLYQEESVPKDVRRSILEAAVRAPEPWQEEAVREAYDSGDRDWMLTAVFAMKYVGGFEKEILQSLKSRDADIHVQAVKAAGDQEVDAAWQHVFDLVANADITPKPLLLAAIGAVASIRQDTDSLEILNHLVDSEDEEVAEAADEALSLAGAYTYSDEDDFQDEGDLKEKDTSGWIN
jgi:hypothetical protein